MSKFEVGDRVECIDNSGWGMVEIGDVGTVTNVYTELTYVLVDRTQLEGCQNHKRWKKIGGKEMAKTKFKKGDTIRHKNSGELGVVISVPGMKEYDEQGYSSASEGFHIRRDGMGSWWERQKHWELVDKVSRYVDLKRRIEGLSNGWDKEADDILQEIGSRLRIQIPCSTDETTWCILIQDVDNKTQQALMYNGDSCTKMSAFRKALVWLLDHSEIKKDEKQSKIDDLQGQIDDLQRKVQGLQDE